MPTYVIKGVRCTLKDGVVKLAPNYCYICNSRKHRQHNHQCKYCKLNIDELESNIIHFAYASYHSNPDDQWFAHAQCYKGKKGTGKRPKWKSHNYLYIINYKDVK